MVCCLELLGCFGPLSEKCFVAEQPLSAEMRSLRLGSKKEGAAKPSTLIQSCLSPLCGFGLKVPQKHVATLSLCLPFAAMSVLVIGAAGAVGKRLIGALAARGERIVAVDKAPALPESIRTLVMHAETNKDVPWGPSMNP